jgi:hypothetical protein
VSSEEEEPHPIYKVPGCRNPIWDSYCGRWVVYRGLKQQPSRRYDEYNFDPRPEPARQRNKVKVKHLKRDAKAQGQRQNSTR